MTVRTRGPATMAVLITLLMQGLPSAQAGMPSKSITIVAQSRPAREVIEDIGTQAGVRMRVSSRVSQLLNGTWNGPADRIFQQFVQSMNLVVSEEAGVMSVYAADEVRSDSFVTATPAAVAREVRGITGANNKVTQGNGIVHATGTPAFVDSVGRIASKLKADPLPSVGAAAGPVPVQPAAAASAPVVSPLVGVAAAAGLPGFQDVAARTAYQIIEPAARVGGYELRSYRLRFEQADDRYVREGRFERIEPGVASRVRASMGMGTIKTTRRELRQGYIEARPAFPNEGATVNVYGEQRDQAKSVTETVSVDGPTVYADNARNMVIIRDTPARMPQYEALINQFDVPRKQIEIEVAIIDVSVDKAREYGVDFGFKLSSLIALFGGLGSTGALAGGAVITNDGDAFLFRLNGLEKRGIVRVTNRFTMMVKENATETYTNMTEVPYEVEGRQGYLAPLEAGTRITATPRIVQMAPNRVATSVRIEVEDANFIALSQQKIPSRRVTTFSGEPEVPLGNSVMIAGQTTERSFESRRKTPLLGDIPVVGEAFKKGEYGMSRTERLFLITPRILAPATSAEPNPARAPVSFEDMDRARGRKAG